MWMIFARQGAAKYVGYLTLPVAVIVGAIGYYVESKLSDQKSIPYLERGLSDQRINRQLAEETRPEFMNYEGIAAEKLKIVPRSSLEINTGRSSS